ncbi:uncharacterized protein [Halyomorpha halys]
MLEKVKQQPQKTTHDILDSAIGWGIPIYSYTKFLVWLEKIARKEVKDPKGIRELRGHYLKLETGCARPDFRQFRVWPRISFNGDEPTAFPKPLSKHDPQRMTRKAGKVAKDSSVAAGGNGYCEMCRVHFDQLDTHIASSQHVRYASDPSHYTQLDSLISHHDLGNMGSLRKSLRIAKSPPVDITIVKATPTAPPEGQTAPVINGHVTRSKSDKVLSNGLSPLQEKRKNSIRGSGGGNSSTVEKKDEPTVKVEQSEDHNLRSRHQPPRVPSTPQTPSAVRRNRLSRKRLSVEEKLIEDNKSYYKVEVLNSKLRSTEFFINQKHIEARVVNDGVVNGNCTPENVPDHIQHKPTPVENKVQDKEPVVVRFKKVRRSQLALLSDEAENFMFGESTKKELKKDEDSSSSDSSESRDSEGSSIAEEVIPKKKVRKPVTNSEVSALHNSIIKDVQQPQVILTPLRLKSPRRVPSAVDLSEEGKDEVSEDDSDMNLDSISFTFENPPKNDPWNETLKRRVEGRDMFYYPHYHNYPKVALPCEYPVSERFKLLAGKKGPGFGKRRDRFLRLLDESKPRKSPRCHASTLAIMSSLMRRRPIRECTSNPDFTYEEESRSSLPETIESSSSASEIRTVLSINGDCNQLPIDPNGDVYAIALARLACGETSNLHVGSGPCLPVSHMFLEDPLPDIGIDLKPGLSIPLESIINQQHNSNQFPRSLDMDFRFLEPDRDSGSDCSDLIGFSDDGRGISGRRRKRKRNLTGWPIEKPRKKVIKKEEEPPPVAPSIMIKCEPCEIKLEPMCPEVLQQLTCSVKHELPTFNGAESPLVPVKRGRGRPRKYPPLLTAVTPLSPATKSSPIKTKQLPRFSFTPRRSCIK